MLTALPDLVKRTGCRVVVPKRALDQVRRLCPEGTEFVLAEEVEKMGWFDGKSIPLAGRGPTAVAYSLRWANKNVLVSGLIPIKVNADTLTPLLKDLVPEGRRREVLQSLDELSRLQPDIWLPLTPANGQNANLYDRDWANVLEENAKVVR